MSRLRAMLVRGVVLVLLPGALLAQDLDLARRQAASGDRAGATVTLESALPNLTTARRAEALLLLSELRETWEEADRDLATLLDDHRDSAYAQEALWRIGVRALAVGEAGRAHAAFGEALAAMPTAERRVELRLRDGQALLLMGQPGEARARLRPLLDELPAGETADRVALLLAACAERELDHAGALRQALDLVGRESALEPAALLQAGRSLLARGEAPLALEYLGQVERDFPDTPAGAEGRVLADSLRRVLGRGRPVAPSATPPPTDPDRGDTDSLDVDPRGRGDRGPVTDVPSTPGHQVPTGPPGRDGDPFGRSSPDVVIDDPRAGDDPISVDSIPPRNDSLFGDVPGAGDPSRDDLPAADGGGAGDRDHDRADHDPIGTDPGAPDTSGGAPPGDGEATGRPPDDDRPGIRDSGSDTGRYEVVLGPFDARIEALSVLSRLRREGRRDVALDLTPDGYTIRVGPIVGRAAAEAEATRLGERDEVPTEVVEER